MKKFGSYLDEDENVWVGGTTLCECCTYIFLCNKNPNRRQKKSDEIAQDDADADFIPDEFADGS